MAVPASIDPARFLHEELVQASPDLLRELMGSFINTLFGAGRHRLRRRLRQPGPGAGEPAQRLPAP